MSETMKKALQSVVDLHTLIENVFTGTVMTIKV